MWAPALLYSSTFLAFLPFGLWMQTAHSIVRSSIALNILLVLLCRIKLPSAIQAANSACVNWLGNCLGCVPVGFPSHIFHLLFLPDCKTMGLYLKLPQWQSVTQQNAYRFWFSSFTSLSLSLSCPPPPAPPSPCPVMEMFQTQILQNGGFRLPSPSTWPPLPSQVEPWKICLWKRRLSIKIYLEEVSLSMRQMSVWWQ